MAWSPESGILDFATLKELYTAHSLKPTDVVRAVYQRLDRYDHVWITRVPLEEALEEAGIPVSTQAGKSLFRRQEIQDLIALTRTLADARD